jgi:hypothetical protein
VDDVGAAWQIAGQTVPTPTDPGDVNAVLAWGLTLTIAALVALFWQLVKTKDGERDRLIKTIDALTDANKEHSESNVAATATMRDMITELVRLRERLEDRRPAR